MGTVAHEAEALAPADDEAEDETGHTGANVNDITAGKVECSDHAADEAALTAPYHVRERGVDKRYP